MPTYSNKCVSFFLLNKNDVTLRPSNGSVVKPECSWPQQTSVGWSRTTAPAHRPPWCDPCRVHRANADAGPCLSVAAILNSLCKEFLSVNVSAILYLMNYEKYGRSTASAQYFLQLAGYLGIPVIAWNADNSGLERVSQSIPLYSCAWWARM